MQPGILFGSWKETRTGGINTEKRRACVDAGRCEATDIDMKSERGRRMQGTIDS